MTESVFLDHFDAVVGGDGVLVRMSENVATTFGFHFDELIRLLDTGEPPDIRIGLFRRRPKLDDVLRKLFPDVYRDRADSDDFRSRHAALLRDCAAIRRVRARFGESTLLVVPHPEVVEWVQVTALLRNFHLVRCGQQCATVIWCKHVLEQLVLAVEPHLDCGCGGTGHHPQYG
ncbi:hypothetical protein Lesp02_53980 [Lentzea sp. NBRC 105346]|uniref:DUF2017 family protein n=1 Tax=Lentzea sp. NBRC 105346 TaxID=3032205 RepID=UPI0024A23C96|nr:hypothetical protein [Lentzea sp. NBRC 105346]GLZ33210.1 hypothetical protein Lesp02_53980 [Lentzea sp. NBRC 105346]